MHHTFLRDSQQYKAYNALYNHIGIYYEGSEAWLSAIGFQNQRAAAQSAQRTANDSPSQHVREQVITNKKESEINKILN